MKLNLFLDIETLDTAPTTIITEIGAVAFQIAPDGNILIAETLHINVSIAHQLAMGRTFSADTIHHRIRNGTLSDTKLLGSTPHLAADHLNSFIDQNDATASLYIWGKDFDRPAMEDFYRSLGRTALIPYWATHCARDAFYYAFGKTRKPRPKTHQALEDCEIALHDLADAIQALPLCKLLHA